MISPEIKQRIAALSADFSASEIATQLGLEPHTVSYLQRVLNLPRRTAKQINQITADRILELHEAGRSTAEIATTLEWDTSRVTSWLRNLHLERRDPHQNERAQCAEQVRALDAQGLTTAAIARKLGWKVCRARRWNKVLGLNPPPPKKVTPSLEEKILRELKRNTLQQDIAKRFHLSPYLIRQISNKNGIAPRRKMRRRWHLKPEEIEQIRELALDGLHVCDIAQQMHITANTVANAKKTMGLPVWPALPEAKVLELLETGMAPRAIAQQLKISYRGTRKFAHEHGFGQPRRILSPAQIARIDKMILLHEKSAMQIGKCCRASYKYVLARAHELLDVEVFLPVWKDPLRSNFPLGNNPPTAGGLST